MALNRLVDAEIDARNPRTAGRELPSGALHRPQVIVFCLLSLAVFLVAVWQLDPIVRWLWPIPVAMFVLYPYLKRFTWLSHFWLGAVDGLAPVGGWVAVTGELPLAAWLLGGAVATWVAGFDVLYALFDSRSTGARGCTRSPPASASAATFWASRALHVATVAAARLGGRGALGRHLVLARRRRRRRAPRLRAAARLAGRPAAPEHGVLHDERRDQPRLLRLRAPGCDRVIRARGLVKRYGDRRVLRGVDLDLPRGGLPARHRAERLGKDDAAPALRWSLRAYRRRARGRRRRARRSASSATSRSATAS